MRRHFTFEKVKARGASRCAACGFPEGRKFQYALRKGTDLLYDRYPFLLSFVQWCNPPWTLSVWSLSFHLFSFCTDCTVMFMADMLHLSVDPLLDAFLSAYLKDLKMFPLRTYLLMRSWSTVWLMRWSEIWDFSWYFSSCIFPVFDRFRSLGFYLLGFICLLVCFSLYSGWHRIHQSVRQLSNRFLKFKEIICSNEIHHYLRVLNSDVCS